MNTKWNLVCQKGKKREKKGKLEGFLKLCESLKKKGGGEGIIFYKGKQLGPSQKPRKYQLILKKKIEDPGTQRAHEDESNVSYVGK